MSLIVYCLLPLFCLRLIYLICTPERVRFDRYIEWSFYNPDGSDRGVILIDPVYQGSPDYHPPDAARRYPKYQPVPRGRWVSRLAWGVGVAMLLLAMWR